MLKAVIFDMDGVIIDSEPTNLRALHKAVLSCGVLVTENYCNRFIGCSLPNTVSTICNDYQVALNEKEVGSLYIKYQTELIESEGYQPIKGTIALIKGLHANGIKLAIASSSSVSEIKRMADSLQLTEYFDELVSGQEVTHSKPAPDVFLLAAARLNVSPDDCLIIEDSMNGSLAAKAAGITCLGFQNPNSGDQDLSNAYSLMLDMDGITYSYLLEQYNHAHNLPVTIIQTERVLVRELCEDDIHALFQLYDCKSAKTYLPPLSSKEEELAKLKAYIKHMYHFTGFGLWGVFDLATNSLIGRIGIQTVDLEDDVKVELGYFIHDDYQHMGYATETIQALLPLMKENYELDHLVCLIAPDNLPSIAFAKKLGMKKVGTTISDKKNYDLYRLILI